MKSKNNLEDIIIGDEMAWFKFNKGINEQTDEYIKARNGIENPDRRKFLGNTGKIAGAVAVTGFGGLIPKDAKSKELEYPPGIANCRDENIKDAYWWSEARYSFKGWKPINYVTSSLRFIRYRGPMTSTVDKTTPYIEPAYWFICAKIGDMPLGTDIMSSLSKENKPLDYFKSGIEKFYEMWIRKEKKNTHEIERYFLTSIFQAANRNESEVQEYLRLNIQEKEQYLRRIMGIYENMKIDKDARQINDNYNKLLCAAWSSFILTCHYYRLEGKGEKSLNIYQNIEKPIRKFIPRIRGPPHFPSL